VPDTRGISDLRNLVVYVLTRMAWVRVTFEELRTQTTIDASAVVPTHPLNPSQAELLFKSQREDSARTDEKVRQLLTVSASLAAIIAVFARDVRPRGLVVLLLALLVACVYLCLHVLDVRTEVVPTLENADTDSNQRQWARDLLWSCFANRARHRLRVEHFRAAGRYFVAALLVTPFVAAFATAKPDPIPSLRAAVVHVGDAMDQLERQLDTIAAHGLSVHQTGPSGVAKQQNTPTNTKRHKP
jgi:hypothetical protein